MTNPEDFPVNKSVPETHESVTEQALDPEDFYYEGPFLVFTATYHLKRGYCCNSGCRHCPYK
jgi:Family of unknown function (DUF5522)